MNISVADLVFASLAEMGADGLMNDVGECGCPLDDLSPACCLSECCKAASFVPMDCNERSEFGAPDGAFWYVPFRG